MYIHVYNKETGKIVMTSGAYDSESEALKELPNNLKTPNFGYEFTCDNKRSPMLLHRISVKVGNLCT